MADDSNTESDAGDGGGFLSNTPALLLVLVVGLGALAGGVAGSRYVAPLLGSAPSTGQSAPTGSESGESGGQAGAQKSGASELHEVGNMVVNPAGSGGSRFLMITVSLEVTPPGVTETLSENDARIRDLLNRVLGSRTVAELSDIDRRDEIKAEIRTSINETLDDGRVKAVYTPQYVLQ